MNDGSGDRLEHALPVCYHIVIAEPQHEVALRSEVCIALCVALDALGFVVLSAINLDDESCRMTHEIDNERANRCLTPKARAVHPMCADCVPDDPFGVGQIAAEPARAGALLS
jgi:hypothetical protein